MNQLRSEREGHLTKIIGTAAGRLYVMSEYKRSIGMPADTLPAGAMPFSEMIQTILNHEFAT